MVVLFSAIVLASLLGSTHCVGMCGPLALWASGSTQQSRAKVAWNTTLYHAGRLVTYVLMGIAAGAIGQLVELGGETIGLRMMAARIVGVFMIVVGLWRLGALLPISLPRDRSGVQGASPTPSLITGILVKLRPLVFRLPDSARGLATGLLTAFLPCGWLYVFAFVAAGTASASSGAAVMVAFWIGTVPLLTGLIVSANMFNAKLRSVVPIVASILLVVTGVYTARGNGFASPDALAGLEIIAQEKDDPVISPNAPLPCCCGDQQECDLP